MKSKNWLYILLILLCLGAFFGYRAWDSIRTDSEVPKITVSDGVPEFSVLDEKTVLLQGVTASDKTDGDVTNSLVVESVSLLDKDGTVSVSYAAFDAAGNVAKAQRTVKYTDYESPRLTLSGPLAYPSGSSFDVLSTVGATDVLDGDIQHRVRATALEQGSIAVTGTHNVQFQVTNSLGDTVTQVFPVDVYAADEYNASLSLTSYIVYLNVGDSFNASKYLDTFTLQGEGTSLRSGLPRNFSMKTTGQVDTTQPGAYSVQIRVTYTDRHETNAELDRQYTGYSKLIVVVEG
ncbi:MAG: hypothetical protein IJ001_11235 [Oscillospiraceae bacterium]|nr:hypothetical protein [Oscillospiraceae bacterium]